MRAAAGRLTIFRDGVKAAVHGGKFVSPLNLKQRRKLQDTCSLKDITRLVCYFSSDTCSDMLVVRREKILCPEIERLPRHIARDGPEASFRGPPFF